MGKSTLFNALTSAGAASERYPFCTLEPNVGVVPVPDPRPHVPHGLVATQPGIPAAVEIVDIAAWCAAPAGAKGSATSSSVPSATWTRCCTSCAASRTRTACTWTARWAPSATSRPSRRAAPRRPRLREPPPRQAQQADLAGLRTYFTAGEKEIRAWTIHEGWTAPRAAGVIHPGFERGFIRAEVYRIPELQAAGSEAALKAAGKLRVEGKGYEVQDGDVMHFRFNV